ncbi:MAG TPA: hypothetical protein VN203_21510 [Candidatus Acidoferrum sp.]|nr:hypothetical protein [Candidatus Acidoferrum sp.]
MRGLQILLLAGVLTTYGCFMAAVTPLGTAEKTYIQDYDAVAAALQKALTMLDIKIGDTKRREENGKIVATEIQAYARDVTITISIDRITDQATRVIVDASKRYLLKDTPTADEILNQTTKNLAKTS